MGALEQLAADVECMRVEHHSHSEGWVVDVKLSMHGVYVSYHGTTLDDAVQKARRGLPALRRGKQRYDDMIDTWKSQRPAESPTAAPKKKILKRSS